ncbi:hypothetical protein B9Z55_022635 [Caenorhabditis nigoni]|uniref:Uncharacterized protein n=1 Tax=Caenorhabditis nigoni TaxID=1611254 RepID=A0A2G5SL98_9PELO|nr:hypothetical protein B9Z55_022635 [Caenorhabditis nigoni]
MPKSDGQAENKGHSSFLNCSSLSSSPTASTKSHEDLLSYLWSLLTNQKSTVKSLKVADKPASSHNESLEKNATHIFADALVPEEPEVLELTTSATTTMRANSMITPLCFQWITSHNSMDTFYGRFRTKESKTSEPVKTFNTVHHVIMSMPDIRIKGAIRIRIKNVIISQQLNSGPYIGGHCSYNRALQTLKRACDLITI